MDLMCGGSLRERIEQRDGVPFGERRAAHFVRQITTGLAYLHEQARSCRSAAASDGAVTPLLARTRGAAPPGDFREYTSRRCGVRGCEARRSHLGLSHVCLSHFRLVPTQGCDARRSLPRAGGPIRASVAAYIGWHGMAWHGMAWHGVYGPHGISRVHVAHSPRTRRARPCELSCRAFPLCSPSPPIRAEPSAAQRPCDDHHRAWCIGTSNPRTSCCRTHRRRRRSRSPTSGSPVCQRA